MEICGRATRSPYSAGSGSGSESRWTAGSGTTRSSPTATSPPPCSGGSSGSVISGGTRSLLPPPSIANEVGALLSVFYFIENLNVIENGLIIMSLIASGGVSFI